MRTVNWDSHNRARLEAALNEADVVGVRLNPAGAQLDVLLHVLSLPASGPLAKDGRRILRLSSPCELRFLLRTDRAGEPPHSSPPLPLAGLAAVESFFASLSWGGSIYGWRFFDNPTLTSDWPTEPSLVVRLKDSAARHTFYWFNECGIEQEGEVSALCFEGTITFDDLCVLDADEVEIPIETFISDGERQWDALFALDERLTVKAQREAQLGAPKWRAWATHGEAVQQPM